MEDLFGLLIASLTALLGTGAVAGKLYYELRKLRSDTTKKEKADVRQGEEQDDIRRHNNWLLTRMEKLLETEQERGENRLRRMLELEALNEAKDERIEELETRLARYEVEDQVIREVKRKEGREEEGDADPAG